MCGEKKKVSDITDAKKGSPPHVRGKAAKEIANKLNKRITPACAGKSDIHANGFCCPRDHPRMCGEKNVEMLKSLWKLGSPPHVRGKVLNC